MQRVNTTYIISARYFKTFIFEKISEYGKCSKISNNFLIQFSNKMMVIKARMSEKMTGKLLIRLLPQSDLGLRCLSRPFGRAIYDDMMN